MNIVIVTAGDYPYGMAAETLVRNLALGIHENGDIVEVVRFRGRRFDFNNDTPVKSSNFLFPKPLKNEGLKFFELAAIIAWIPLFVAYRKLNRKDSAIVLYGIDYAYQIVPFILWSSLFKIKCYRIITDHYKRSTIMPVWWKAPKLLFCNMQHRFFDKHLSGLIVLTSYLYNRCLQFGVDRKKLLLIPHFIQLNSIDSGAMEDGDIIIGFCGTPSISNGVIDLLRAFEEVNAMFPATCLLIIGEVNKEIKDYARNNIGIDCRKIVFTGYVPSNEIAEHLSKCTILVNPRQSGLREQAGFPTKLGEYFAAKKPVVATRIGDLNTYFNNREQLVFAEPNNPSSIAQGIIYLILNPKDARDVAEGGNKWAYCNLDYLRNSGKLLSFIAGTSG